jgi:hypothetical protein
MANFLSEVFMTKYILLTLSSFFFNNKDSVLSPRAKTTDYIKKTIRGEVMSVGLKLLIGLVLVAVMIYSLIELGQAYQVFLNQFENSLVYEMISFTVILAISGLLLYRTFNKKEKIEVKPSINVPNLFFNFKNGFVEGVQTRRAQKNIEQINTF